ncbi:ABC-type phosphate/phosphonate transport system, permease component [Schinkia azotoformans MEV2011]|uniref:ABC-type phosphate/phosphonate transport system, permease component n=1 Tax=Schinkia azotoformans MEV2011 TaxID=1348973 RepID=A0A072NRC6_SCHAZ|nr:ABC transporter permease subunit [Schinkia azotoformans]KEF40021.1 ABC-type phosphate/phosphonate transport system, permease component [Schinkia azotoformans MEV2011]MEC1694717.1 ABC transporter permease subunit [Schinkia azotoformans]MEC1716921.1 ABC transporter permease subunit [Schinkia azotoformans]MEC1726400.1 ABC transporter permease subunit [Schinkia azotoformans]MEC1743203.1 ABC transporter permease subunit [Schinkia azotoformans]
MKNEKNLRRPAKIGVIKLSVLLIFALVLSSWLFIFVGEDASLFDLFSEENLVYTKEFFNGLAGVGEEHPAFLSKESWLEALKLSVETLQMSIMAIGFSVIIMVLTVIPAARNVANGTLTLSRKWYGKIVYGIIRGFYIFSRSVPELIWAMIIIFIFKPGILPGAIALALHNFGILGKLCAEVIEDVDTRPIRSLASSGAGKAQMFIYGVIPTVLPQFITYILYRWEVIIRTTIVVGFVGAGGLGQAFKLSMSWFHYSDITLFLICYVLLVILTDSISEGIRRFIK